VVDPTPTTPWSSIAIDSSLKTCVYLPFALPDAVHDFGPKALFVSVYLFTV
jgi:hypothetical protein